MKITVVIPSKGRSKQKLFVARAIESIRLQRMQIDIRVVVDTVEQLYCDATVLQGSGGQAAAMNKGAEGDSDYLAFLEDDDCFSALRVMAALEALQTCDFTSSTQLEMELTGEVVRINDFPTPSGWFMRREVWQKIGGFNPEYKYHLDNEWLGRLYQSDFKRVHLVECTAPIKPDPMRPFLSSIVKRGGMDSTLKRHASPLPLIERTVHAQSGMTIISLSSREGAISAKESTQLIAKYGFMPI